MWPWYNDRKKVRAQKSWNALITHQLKETRGWQSGGACCRKAVIRIKASLCPQTSRLMVLTWKKQLTSKMQWEVKLRQKWKSLCVSTHVYVGMCSSAACHVMYDSFSDSWSLPRSSCSLWLVNGFIISHVWEQGRQGEHLAGGGLSLYKRKFFFCQFGHGANILNTFKSSNKEQRYRTLKCT